MKYVLTGGPGVGKTTLIEILASKGFQIIPEAARIIIEEESLKDSDILPWKNIYKFQEEVVRKQLELESQFGDGVAFLDRSIVDGHAYCQIASVSTPPVVLEKAPNRYNEIFFLEHLGFHENDSVRKETLEEGRILHEKIREAYIEFGYTPILVPVMSPADRADYILERIR